MRWICIIFLTVVLIGCSNQPQSKHTVNFSPDELFLERIEQEELEDFIFSHTCFEIDGPRSGSGFFDPVTASRIWELQHYLEALGYHVIVPKQSFWVDNGLISISIRMCGRKAA